MQQLIQSLQEKTGLSADKAKEAVQLVINFVKSKLPVSMHRPIDSAISGGIVPGVIKGASDKLDGLI